MRDFIKRGLEDLSRELVAALVIIAVIVAAGAIWAFALSWEGPTIMLLIVGLLAGMFLIADRAVHLYRQTEPPISKRADIQAILQKWALGYGYRVHNSKDRPLLASVMGAEDSTLLADLQIELARFGVGFAFIGNPLESILLEDKLLLDESLNKVIFMQRYMFIRRATALLEILVNQAVARAKARNGVTQSTPDK